MDDDIDDTWVTDYKKEEEQYNDFYNEKVINIKIFFMYINTEKTLVSMRQESVSLNEDSILTKDRLIKIIKDKQHLNNIKYKLFSVVRYNIDLQPDEMSEFISDDRSNTISDDSIYTNRFFINEQNINDIYFTDTISIFQDINALYIIFKEQTNNNAKNLFTKKLKHFKKKTRHTRHKKYI